MAKYTILPAAKGDFASLDLMTRAVFGLIWDRWQLSLKSFDSRGVFATKTRKTLEEILPDHKGDKRTVDVAEVYCVIAQSELIAETGLCERTIRKCIRSLETAGIMRTERAGIRGANRYYINHLLVNYFTSQNK